MLVSKYRWFSSVIILVVLLSGLALTDFGRAASSTPQATSQQNTSPDASSKIENDVLSAISADGSADFILRFTEQADLSPAYSMDWNARGEFVYNTLRETAAISQAHAKAILDTEGLKYQTFIAGNDLYVYAGTLPTVNAMVSLPEVSSIRSARTYSIDPYVEASSFSNLTWPGDLLSRNALTTVVAAPQATVDWGITDTKAPTFWSTFGVKGDGIVVASIDSGVQWNHPALINQFKCPGDPTNSACWYDPSNICGSSGACDNLGHGTHTMGTMVAKDDSSLSYIAGMAPNAKWIACKGCESNDCSSSALLACADWILAPGGSTANRPNIVNNSWGGGGGDTWYQADVQAWQAAGIFPAFSAGNAGPGCQTLGSPGDYPESFASAAHDINRAIAYFSSKGPSKVPNNTYTKPNISAPGVSICSTVPINGWSCGYNGTSMASPHTAGAVALLWSCDPYLIGNIDATFQLLQNNTDASSASSCGTPPVGNYIFGYGYLDVLKAGQAGCDPTAILLSAYSTQALPEGIQLTWRTAQELNLQGFYTYRADSPEGLKNQLNSQLIPAQDPGQFQANEYSFIDSTAVVGTTYYYWVEWVEATGSQLFGPMTAILQSNWFWLPISLK